MADRAEGPGDVLHRLVEGTARSTGAAFFEALVANLAPGIGAAYALVAEFAGSPERVRTLAFFGAGRLLANVEYDLAGTPCEAVARGGTAHHPRDLQAAFPADAMLRELGLESYLGVPLCDGAGAVLGHLAVLHTGPLAEDASRFAIVEIFAARAAAELERLRAERALRESEQRFRDLYEEAPIAYIYEDTESRFVSANRAAARLLGLRPEEVAGTMGRTLLADSAETQARITEALGALQHGEERASVELELRRKDDGRPVFVQWWSRPEPDGKHTRTMLVDVTARVLAERERNRLRQQNRYLQEELRVAHNFEEIVGANGSLRALLEKLAQVAATDATILILGETGTGKELVARAAHHASRRADGPLIKVNCAALSPGLIESELFGHEKGAFTGALERRVGRFALADGGTIFLDEIGDITPELQLRLLRVLQEREFEPVGSSKTVKVDVRVIAATHRDLVRAVAEGTFRADLYYRLNVFPIHVPPLRERREDIVLLAHYFIDKYIARSGRRIEAIAPESLRRISEYPWPGNVRELENVIERAVILATGPTLELEPDVLRVASVSAAPAAPPASRPPPAGATLADSERLAIVRALERCEWRIEGPRGAAHSLGLQPSTLRSRMRRLGIQRRAVAP